MDRDSGNDRRTLAWLSFGLVLSVALSGCVSDQSSASNLQLVANHNADNWHPDATLVLVLGGEGTVSLQDTFEHWDVDALNSTPVVALANASLWDRVVDDPTPGDGHSEIWVFVYQAGNSERHLVLVFDREQDLLLQQELETPTFSGLVRDYNLDSDQAVRIAGQESQGFSDVLQQERFTLTMLLVQTPEQPGPVWLLLAASPDLEPSGWRVMVDARNGGLLQNEAVHLAE